jgi:hypothetical protein
MQINHPVFVLVNVDLCRDVCLTRGTVTPYGSTMVISAVVSHDRPMQ